jgi:hypothetical protein
VSTEIPLRAAYSVAELARASNLERRRLARVLEQAGVSFVMAGRNRLVPLAELERKVAPLWDSIKATYALAGEER